MIVVVAFCVSGLFLLAWPFCAVMSVFLFDSPPKPLTWVTAYGVWTYPAIWGIALYFAILGLKLEWNRSLVVGISAIPFVPLLLLLGWHA